MKKNILTIIFIALSSFLGVSCKNAIQNNTFFPKEYNGIWRLEVELPEANVPFHIHIENANEVYTINAEEKLAFDKVEIKGDSLFLTFELYDGYIEALIQDDKLNGVLKKTSGKEVRSFPVSGMKGDSIRFHNPQLLTISPLAKKYEVTFYINENERPALGIFEKKEDKVTGSFLTTTGDYRFLQGNIVGDSLYLSAYTGNAVLYKAKIVGDSLLGISYNTYSAPRQWKGVKNENYSLPDPYSLTYLKEGYDKIDFTFPDISGKNISLSDKQFEGKVKVIQILGTWCPNCMDEAIFLKEYKDKNPDIEIIGVAFERSENPIERIKKYIDRFEIQYPILYAGSVLESSEKLPMLNKIMSYPTTIIIDKKGNVRKIHTGFRGQGTGTYYEEYVEEFNKLIKKLKEE